METQNYSELNLKVTKDIDQKGRPSLLIVKIKTKARFPKPIVNAYGKDQEQIDNYLEKFIANEREKLQEKKRKKEARKRVVESFKNPYKVGHIFYDSWGYEQTNIDFYQVVKVLPKSVIIREIASKITDREAGFDSGYKVPVKDNFIGEEERKNVQFYIQNDGSPEFYIKSRHGWISDYEDGREILSTWYH